MEEYGTEGMVHISEVSSGWVKDIRNFVKVGQTGVAKVMRIEDNHISLSLKRVDRNQENNKTKEYRLNQRAEKMLHMVAEAMKKTLDKAYEEVGFLLQENFGSLYEGFKVSLTNPQMLRDRGVPEKWIEQMKIVAERTIVQKEFEFKARLFVKTYKPSGINIIKAILASAEQSGLEVKYIAAPEYLVKYKSMNAKKGEKEFVEKLENLKSKDVELSFESVKS
ncbi:MAG: translation initiation factor IF-2 subunit alpha [Candidatus Aenigmarchaeota archaeon]|nr:translation initiation factor IF-2 subunit alpha [Candidatus Aenigmarchaeota archaeon]